MSKTIVTNLAFMVFACLSTSAVAQVESQRPNLVVILVDDLGYSDLGCYGSEIETPYLDGLAEAGVRFSQFYNTARCCPSRASLLTGLYQHQAGIGFMTYADWGEGYEGTLNENCVTLGEALKKAGYTTCVSGKWHVAAHKNPPSHSLPENRGFDRSTVVRTHIDSYWKVLKGCDVYQDGKVLIPGNDKNKSLKNPYHPEKDFYTTEYFTDVALEYVDDAIKESDQPFFLYLAYNVPHFPLEAPDKTIAKYETKFDDPSWIAEYGRGWDEMREKKLARQKALGLVAADQKLPEVSYFNNKKIMPGLQTGFEHNALPKWNDLPENIKKEVLFRRAIYNAQIDNLDENIGRLTDKLKSEGVYDDTLILFMSDNGCSGEMGRFGTHFEGGKYDHTEARFENGKYIPGGAKEPGQWPHNDKVGGVGYKKSNYDQWKKASGWATSQGQCWASYSNTPFRKFKKFVHEGGIATPLIAHWPNGITAEGKIVNKQYFHFMDVMPTLLEVAGAEYPSVFKGKVRTPLEGVSMLPYMQDPNKDSQERLLFWQHETHSAVRKGNWKIVTDNDRADNITWELYDLANDRSETANVADEHPQVVKELSDEWHKFARRVHVTPFPERRVEPKIKASVKEADTGALTDANEPSSSSDYRIDRLSFHPSKGSTEWVQFDFPEAKQIENFGVYWFDEAQGAAYRKNDRKEVLPQSWKLFYWLDNRWQVADANPAKYRVERDQYNFVKLDEPITTDKLKIEVKLHDGLSAGILSYKINGVIPSDEETVFVDPDLELKRIKGKAQVTMALDVDEFNGYSHLNGNRSEFDGWLDKHNNSEFLQKNVPKFLCSDEDFTEVFNYRWWMISKHLKEWQEDGQDFYVFTEFPGFPGWSSNSGAIPAPAGHQFYDLRWMRDSKYLKSYAEYWMAGPASHKMQRQNNTWLSTLPRPQSHHYTSWMVDASEAMLKVHPDSEWRDRMLPAMEEHQRVWDTIFEVNAPGLKTDGLYKCLDMYDANEFTISTTLGLVAAQGEFSGYTAEIDREQPNAGRERWRRYFTDGKGWARAFQEGLKSNPLVYPQAYDLKSYTTVAQPFGGNHDWYIDKEGNRKSKAPKSYPNIFTVRPSLNCYMYGNYRALGDLYALKAAESNSEADRSSARQYSQKATKLQQKVIDALWHAPSNRDEYLFYEKRGAIADPFFYTRLAGDNLYTGGVGDKLSIIRESVGYTPWYFNMVPQEDAKYDVAWKQFDDEMGFKQPFGMSTAEYRHDFFNEMSYGWNGRGWPFQNSVVYKAYANFLRNYKKTRSDINDADRQLLYHHMNQYVELHGRRRSIGEWYMPRTGGYSMPGGGDVVQSKPAMGKAFGAVQDYFHSTFPDMLIEDLLGFKSSHSKEFTIHPLLPGDKWEYFYLGDLRYHGHDVDIIWKKDWDDDRAGNQSKLYVWIDNKRVAESDLLNQPLTVRLP
jgi:arylsulfatase A-like enzyme